MAEFVMRDLVNKQGLGAHFHIASAATSTEEIGNPVHYGTRKKLREVGISTEGKYAVQLKRSDYKNYDFLIGMDSMNRRNILRIIGRDDEHKVFNLLEFAGDSEDIADPWYTGNFDRTYNDILRGCRAFLEYLQNKNKISDVE